VVKVEVMEALDALGEQGTPENILQVQKLIGICVPLPPDVSMGGFSLLRSGL
jgi:hypothetical protein